ncbi:helix-turn-helix domain-containing protein [bacterium]|nr:helix-turn-helix domain-containing protein [bacterium]
MITVGEVLKKQRELLERTLKEASLDTKIQLRFLKYLEDNNFEKFDSDIYAQGFLKIYASYLNLNTERILAIYRRSVPFKTKSSESLRETPRVKNRFPSITPKLLAVFITTIFLVSTLAYIGYQIYQFQSPPKISISSPDNDSSVENEIIDVRGLTDPNTTLFVNDLPIETTADGDFHTEISLNPGINLITITAKKNNNTQESVEIIKITYNAPQEAEEEEQEEKIDKLNILKLSIINSSVWVQLNIDNTNKLSQIVQVGEEYEYEVKENFTFTTGKLGSTQIFFNDTEVNIPLNSSHVGFLSCDIVEKDQLDCE